MREKERHDNHWEQDWLEGKISSDDAVKHVDNAPDFHLLDKYVKGFKAMDAPEGISKAEAWNILEAKINEASNSETKVIPLYRKSWFIGIAASFTLLMGALFLLNRPQDISVTTGFAETEMIYLPDSSIIHLNADSEVSYSEKGWKENREILLDGEAFFEVKRGSNFEVRTENGSVQVLGTSFNVRTRDEVFSVACKTGKVGVSNDENEVILTPGLSTRTKKGLLIDPVQVSINSVDSWRMGETFLEGATLQDALKELERIHGVTVTHDLLEADLEGTGTFYIDTNNLTDAVQSISLTKGLDFELEDDKVTFSYKLK